MVFVDFVKIFQIIVRLGNVIFNIVVANTAKIFLTFGSTAKLFSLSQLLLFTVVFHNLIYLYVNFIFHQICNLPILIYHTSDQSCQKFYASNVSKVQFD